MWACTAAQRDRWQHTACVLAMLANCSRDPNKSKAFAPSDFMPSEHAPAKPPPLKTDIGALKMFLKGP